MSKVICDVCGTTYPETAPQCPICNSAKNSVDQTAAGSTGEMGEGSYAYVKGGRFSKKNVRKRNNNGTTAQRKSSGNDEPSNTGLVVVVILLLLAIAAVVVYIGIHFFSTDSGEDSIGSTTTAPTEQPQPSTQGQTEAPPEQRIPCEDLTISAQILEFTQADETWTLVVSLAPVDTTDEVSFSTSNPDVATVSDNGIITAVGYGEAEITVSCGDVSKSCSVICKFDPPEPTDEPTEPSTDPENPGEFEFAFNTPFTDSTTGYGDTTLSAQGKTWTAYKSSLTVDPSLITWTSDDEAVCTVENGIVTAVGGGKTLIHATYNGVTYSCIIRCPFKTSDSGSSGESSSGNSSENSSDKACKISHTDVTLSVGSSFKLTLKDAEGKVIDVTWVANDDHVTIDGNKITGVSSGNVKVSVTYEGETYTCIVRVK